MKINASKFCDGCRDRVATKGLILWHTIKDFVTIRRDDVPTYVNYEDATTPMEQYYCHECWEKITENLPYKKEAK